MNWLEHCLNSISLGLVFSHASVLFLWLVVAWVQWKTGSRLLEFVVGTDPSIISGSGS